MVVENPSWPSPLSSPSHPSAFNTRVMKKERVRRVDHLRAVDKMEDLDYENLKKTLWQKRMSLWQNQTFMDSADYWARREEANPIVMCFK